MAAQNAEVGDDVFGDDPTVKALERRVALLFGKEEALFVPSGTQGNLISILAHCWTRGSEFVVGDQAHLHIFEQGGAAQFGGAHPRALPTQPDGTIGDATAMAAAIRPSDQHFPVTAAIALENTHNLCGGKVKATARVAEEDGTHSLSLALAPDFARTSTLSLSLSSAGAQNGLRGRGGRHSARGGCRRAYGRRAHMTRPHPTQTLSLSLTHTPNPDQARAYGTRRRH